MGLPATIRVKLSSEEAGAIAVTPVVVREMPLGELVALMLDLAGKDAGRVRELLLRGTLVSGASRYRWAGWQADLGDLEELLASLPGPDPTRPFVPDRCVQVWMQGPALRAEVPAAALTRRRLLRRRSFWDVLMEAVAEGGLEYAGYSYKDRADRFRLKVTDEASRRIRENAGLLCYTSLENQIRLGRVENVEFVVERTPV
jgi:pimeloyl-ACP methyl ester carboxylesterase